MKSLFFVLLLMVVSIQTAFSQNSQSQRFNVVTNANIFFVFVNDSLSGEIIKNAKVVLVNKNDTLKGEKSRFFSPDNPFAFPLFTGRNIEIIASSPGYKSKKYSVSPSKKKQWLEVQMVKVE